VLRFEGEWRASLLFTLIHFPEMSHDEAVHDSHDEERQDEQDDIQQNGEHLLPGRLGPHLSALPATCEHELTISGMNRVRAGAPFRS
jgi:hypothetical protein